MFGGVRSAWPQAVATAAPGLAVVVAAVAAAVVLNRVFPVIGVPTTALLVGMLAANLGLGTPRVLAGGLRFASRGLLRIAVVLLGLRLDLGGLMTLGPAVLVVVVLVVAITFVATVLIGRRTGVNDGLTLLVATGFSICGASAIAAMNGVRRQGEGDVAAAPELVTLFGTASMFLLPQAQLVLGMTDTTYGLWVGASVHEVAQVVAAAAPVASALAIAVVVKLVRVVLLAPLLALIGLRTTTETSGGTARRRTPIMPLFVLGFIALAILRSLDVVPVAVVATASAADGFLLAGALFGLGTAVRLKSLVHNGIRALMLGAISTLPITVLAAAGFLLVT